MKTIVALLSVTMVSVLGAAPTVSVTSVTQRADESLVVAYSLADEDAVVTMDVLQGGVSIGDKALWAVEGDVNQKVAVGTHTIVWHPDVSWPGHKASETSVQVQLRAWPTNDTPDYLVVDLAQTSDARIRYYTSTNAIPGGLMQQEYRISKMVFRKIKAKGVSWKMGPDSAQHDVTLDHNYYIGVFELTAGQSQTLGGSAGYFGGVEYQMRAFDDRNGMTGVRGNKTECLYPNAPLSTSLLGKLRTLCNDEIDFDLPGESEWEFAARAGHANGFWGDGSRESIVGDVDANLSRLARYAKHEGLIGGTLNPYSSCNYTIGVTNGVGIVGSYAPNSWGLYDMHGNCGEYCIDMWKDDITSDGGAIIVPTTTGYSHVFKGGRYQDTPAASRASYRDHYSGYSSAGGGYGCRFACHAGLK